MSLVVTLTLSLRMRDKCKTPVCTDTHNMYGTHATGGFFNCCEELFKISWQVGKEVIDRPTIYQSPSTKVCPARVLIEAATTVVAIPR